MSKLIIAAAGSGKTEKIVNLALNEHRNVLITTYTDNNVEEIKSRFYQKVGVIPKNITILPWYTFMLTHGVKPYQDLKFKDDINGLCITGGASAKFINKEEKAYYEAVAKIAQKPLRIFMQEAINEKIERDHLR